MRRLLLVLSLCAAFDFRSPDVCGRALRLSSRLRATVEPCTVGKLETMDAFQDALKNAGDALVIVDFSTSTCVPCQQFAPQYQRVSEYYPEFHFFAVVGDDSSGAMDIMKSQGVQSVPQFHIFKRGEQVSVIAGRKALNAMDIIDEIEKHRWRK